MNCQGGNVISYLHSGMEDEELIGLQLMERKRMRGGPDSYEVMDTAGGLKKDVQMTENKQITEVELSGSDCSTSPNILLAKLTRQASQKP